MSGLNVWPAHFKRKSSPILIRNIIDFCALAETIFNAGSTKKNKRNKRNKMKETPYIRGYGGYDSK